MNKLVSVIIPTYNRELSIGRAIESVLNQTYKNIEIIIVDDNSNDNTYDIVRQFCSKYDFIKYIKHKQNKGGSGARNTGSKEAKGEFLAFLDSDDEWINTKLEKNMNLFESDKEIAMVYSDMFLVDIETNQEKHHISPVCEDKYHAILGQNIIGSTSLVVIKKGAFEKVGGFKEGLPSCQDWYFYINVAKEYKIEKVNEPLLKYYVHSNSISGNLKNVIKGHEIIFDKVRGLLKEEEETKAKVILAEQYITMAQIYRKFNKFNESRKCYFNAYKMNKKNLKAIKNLIFMTLGEQAYFKLRKA